MKIGPHVSLPENELLQLIGLLDAFWRDMNCWELACGEMAKRESKGELHHSEFKLAAVSAAKTIFDRYCDSDNPKRILGGRFNYTEPPEYDADLDELIAATATKSGYDIQVMGGGDFGMLFRYKIVRRNNVLKLADQRVLLGDGDPVSSGI